MQETTGQETTGNEGTVNERSPEEAGRQEGGAVAAGVAGSPAGDGGPELFSPTRPVEDERAIRPGSFASGFEGVGMALASWVGQKMEQLPAPTVTYKERKWIVRGFSPAGLLGLEIPAQKERELVPLTTELLNQLLPQLTV